MGQVGERADVTHVMLAPMRIGLALHAAVLLRVG
jgi:hypothetical protein